jgi:two-component system, OmpR family, sensor kinase
MGERAGWVAGRGRDDGYQGPERRGSRGCASAPATTVGTACDILALLLCVAVGLSLTRLLGSGQPVLAWRTGLGAVGAVVATVSGVLSLVQHRLSGDARLAYLGTALVGYGAVAIPLGAVALQHGVDVVEIGAWRVGAAIAVLVLAARGLASPPVDSRLSVSRLAAGASTVGALVSVALMAGTSLLDTFALDLASRALELGWLLLALGYVGTGLGLGRRVLFRAGCGLLLVAVAQALQLVDPDPDSFQALSIATLRLVGVSFVLFALAQDLVVAFRGRLLADHDIRGRWVVAEAAAHDARRDQEERDHEIRNALAGIAGATRALEASDGRPDPAHRSELRRAVRVELERVQSMVRADRPSGTPLRYDVAPVLAPLVAARRALGERVELVCAGDTTTVGRPEALAQVVVNLLTNCARHAEGAPVIVRAERVADQVVVSVLDHGSAQGSARPGRGLGLVVSRRLAQEEGGRLQLVPGERGGFGVSVELPAALRPVCSDLVVSAR